MADMDSRTVGDKHAYFLPINMVEVEHKDTKEKDTVVVVMLYTHAVTKEFCVMGMDYLSPTAPHDAAAEAAYLVTLGVVSETDQKLKDDIAEAQADGTLQRTDIQGEDGQQHVVYLVPCELSTNMLKAFDDEKKKGPFASVRVHTHVDKITGREDTTYVNDVDALAWVPLGPVSSDTTWTSPLTRYLLSSMVAKHAAERKADPEKTFFYKDEVLEESGSCVDHSPK